MTGIYVQHVESGKIEIFPSRNQAMKEHGIDNQTLSIRLSTNGQKSFGGFRWSLNEKFPTLEEIPDGPLQLKTASGSMDFPSLMDAAAFLSRCPYELARSFGKQKKLTLGLTSLEFV